MSTPGIPASWEQCPPDQNICKNGGQCFFDGLAEFCICEDGYGGKQCERLVDAVVFLLDTPLSNEQLARLCKIAFFLGVCAFLAALLGWTCCCLKHLNARRLYLRNMKLARENRMLHEANRRQSKRTVRLYAALARAKTLIGFEQGQQQQELLVYSTDSTPTAEGAGGPIGTTLIQTSANRPIQHSSTDSRRPSLVTTPQSPSPNQRVLMRELSNMHDELRNSIEGVDRIVEILHREDEQEVEKEWQQQQQHFHQSRRRMPSSSSPGNRWNFDDLLERIGGILRNSRDKNADKRRRKEQEDEDGENHEDVEKQQPYQLKLKYHRVKEEQPEEERRREPNGHAI